MTKTTTIDVCITTFRRESLVETIRSVVSQEVPDNISLRIIVADNDAEPSAAERVARVARETDVPVQYIHAPMRNISIARNACLDAAQGDWLAFIDDDEVAAPDWLARLLEAAEEKELTAVFGPAHAQYDSATPEWIRLKDYHTNKPEIRDGVVETGHTCNALVRRTDPAVVGKYFLESKGRSGGEDSEYFFRLRRDGAVFGIADTAKVYEPVASERLSFRWLAKRKYRYGQTYGYHAHEGDSARKLRTVALAGVKVLFCVLAAILFCWSSSERNYWILRGIFHAGVIASAFGASEQALYGTA
ncbi:MAG: glycosyltransferase [Aquisalinus sp.]|nr:glycosyltransferase [Aquisalinus sp.]